MKPSIRNLTSFIFFPLLMILDNQIHKQRNLNDVEERKEEKQRIK